MAFNFLIRFHIVFLSVVSASVALAASTPTVEASVDFSGRHHVVLADKFPLECDRAPDRRDYAFGAVLAEEACAALNMGVPTVYEFADLLRALEHEVPNSTIERPFYGGANLPRLTDRGVAEFSRILKLPADDIEFWSSTRKPSLPDEVANTSAWKFAIGTGPQSRSSEYVGARVFYAKRVLCLAR